MGQIEQMTDVKVVCVCVCVKDLALNNLQWLICHKTQPNRKKLIYFISISISIDILFIYFFFFFNTHLNY